jgi:hypothetical protein
MSLAQGEGQMNEELSLMQGKTADCGNGTIRYVKSSSGL